MSNNSQDQLKKYVFEICNEQDVDVFLFYGPLESPADRTFIDACSLDKKRCDKALLMLTTYGGQASVAYRIARRLQKVYGGYSLYIHTYCKSAGTLIALGADQIIMSDFAEMGPLDVQLLKADELGERSSGLIIRDALETLQTRAFHMFEDYFLSLRIKSGLQITTKSAMEAAANLAVGLYSPIFSQIDPMRLGEIQRAIRIAWEYGERIETDNIKPDTISRLIAGYPDHGFIIDDKEAKTLFKSVRVPNEIELALAEHLEDLVESIIIDDEPIVLNLTYRCLKDCKEGSHEQAEDQTCPTNKTVGADRNWGDGRSVRQETAAGEHREGQETTAGEHREGQETDCREYRDGEKVTSG